MPTKITYSDAQKKAIEGLGSMVITACPGSGKTTVMVEKSAASLKVSNHIKASLEFPLQSSPARSLARSANETEPI